MKTLDFSLPPVAELRYASESMSSYASDAIGAVSKVAGRLRELMPTIKNNFAASQEVGQIEDLKLFTKDEQKFLKILEHASFAEVRQLRADTPEGFVGSFPAYAGVLHSAANNLTNLAAEVLNPYTVFLGQLISSRDAALATDDKKNVYLKMKKEREDGYSAIAHFFPAKNAQGNQRIGQVIGRNGDWPTVFKLMGEAVEKINAVNREQLAQLIALAEDYLGIIHDMLVQGKLDGVTPETSRALADGAYQVASQIEYYALVHFKTLAFTNAVKGTVERVNDILG